MTSCVLTTHAARVLQTTENEDELKVNEEFAFETWLSASIIDDSGKYLKNGFLAWISKDGGLKPLKTGDLCRMNFSCKSCH